MSELPDLPTLPTLPTLSVPDALDGMEMVQSVRTPIRMEYDFIPGENAVGYLRAMAEKKILGAVSPVDGAVFVPPRGVDPRHGVATGEYVELEPHGHVGSFCVTRVPIPNRDDLELPYVSAWIFLDGADQGFLGIVAGCETDDVRLGMQVEAVWKPDDALEQSAANILYWKPTGEPDLPLEQAGVSGWAKRRPQIAGGQP